MRARLWLLRRVGLRRYLAYCRARRAGVVIDYARVFTPEELACVGEHFSPAPWERPA